MSQFNPAMQVTYCRDVRRAMMGAAPSIAMVGQAYGRRTAESWLEIQLYNLSEFAGCKEKIKPWQIAETAQIIADSFPAFKLTEFMLFFQRFKRCRYGRFYGAVDPMVILQSLNEFADERERERARYRAEDEKARRDAQNAETARLEQLCRQRYADKVPAAWTAAAPISYLQWKLMGYNRMPDDQLEHEIADILSGAKTIPTEVEDMLQAFASAYGAIA